MSDWVRRRRGLIPYMFLVLGGLWLTLFFVVLYVLIATDTPLDRKKIDALEPRLRLAAATPDPDAFARAVAKDLEDDPSLSTAALSFVFVRHGRGAS